MSAIQLPLLAIPRFPQIGQPFAFADRDDQVDALHGSIVDAGNALIKSGRSRGPLRIVVTGYKGVGKSSLVLHVLDMLRNPVGVTSSRRNHQGLRDPESPHRWLILRVSGKHVRGIGGLPDDLQRSILSVLEDAAREAEQDIPDVLALPMVHRVLRTKECENFEKIRAALTAFSLTVDFVRAWSGARLTEKVDESRRVDRMSEVKVFLDTQLKLRNIKPESTEGQAAAQLSASFIGKWSHALESRLALEHEISVNADLATEALNQFFAAATAARIPTVLVMDDFDELASSAGTSQRDRAKVLMELLGIFNQLTPTCMVIAVRKEYQHEDLFRQFVEVYVPPMTKEAGADMLKAWARTDVVEWSNEMLEELCAVGNGFIGGFPADAPVVAPDQFAQLVTWAARNRRGAESAADMFKRYLRLRQDGETFRVIYKVAGLLSAEDAEACAETIPIDPAPYALTQTERQALEKSGLLRPAMAWNDGDSRVILDPLIAYLYMAHRPAPAT